MGRVEISRDSKNVPTYCDYSDEWSMRDFTNQKHIFAGRGKELAGLVIYASCFYQEALDTDVFPSDVEGLTLVHCNIDNVNIPPGVTVIENRPKLRIAIQNDLRDWVLDDQDRPIRLVNEKAERMAGRSTDPALIPAERVSDIADLPRIGDYAKAFSAVEAAPTPDEKAVLEALAARSETVTLAGKDLVQVIDEEIDRLSSIKMKMEAGR